MKTNFIASASDLRNRAWNAMSATWGTVVTITFIISIASMAANYVLAALPLPGLLSLFASIAVSMAVTIAQLGLTCGALTYLRRGYIGVDHVKSMFPYWQQVVRFTLWEGLFVFLWMLPGLALSSVGLSMLIPSLPETEHYRIGTSTLLSVFDNLQTIDLTGLAVFILGILLMFVLLARAGLNYLLGGCCLIDHPHMGGRAALKRSGQLMRGHRWRYILMYLPVLLMDVLITAIDHFLSLSMNATLVTIIISILSIAPDVMAVYLVPVLYQELSDRE